MDGRAKSGWCGNRVIQQEGAGDGTIKQVVVFRRHINLRNSATRDLSPLLQISRSNTHTHTVDGDWEREREPLKVKVEQGHADSGSVIQGE